VLVPQQVAFHAPPGIVPVLVPGGEEGLVHNLRVAADERHVLNVSIAVDRVAGYMVVIVAVLPPPDAYTCQ